jgi:lysozyme family protein
MADFQKSLEYTLRFEDPQLAGTITFDDGGVTRFGISSNACPEVYPELEECGRDRALQIASDTYQMKYWRFAGVADQETADKLFDMAVNMGLGEAVKLAQRCAGAAVDGEWGPITERAVNSLPSLVECLISAAEARYKELASADPAKYGKYLNGWMRRAAATG